MKKKHRMSVSESELRQIAIKLPDRKWKLNKFLVTLSLTMSVDFDLTSDRLIISSALITKECQEISIGRLVFAECINAETSSKLDFVLFLRRSKIRVNLVNHGKTPEELIALMETITAFAQIKIF